MVIAQWCFDMRMRICSASSQLSQEMAVAVGVLLAALVGLYWSSSRVEGNATKFNITCYALQLAIRAT